MREGDDMSQPVWREFRGYSGCLVAGSLRVLDPRHPSEHFSCAAYLTAQVEAPYYGMVQSYDGAGISAGLLHSILIYPATMEQGELGPVTASLLDALGPSGTSLTSLLAAQGWHLDQGGVFRDASGAAVSGQALRNWAAPPDGKVPQSGPEWDQACQVASAFHACFSDPVGFDVQEQQAVKWLLARCGHGVALSAYQHFLPAGKALDGLAVADLPPPVHVAMCVFNSFLVNSPAVALRCLSVTSLNQDPSSFAHQLIRRLGTEGRDVWHDQPGDGNDRYDRTRVAAWMRPDLFPGCHDLMPQDL